MLCYVMLLPTTYVLICRNGIPGSTGDCVAGSSAAYENQAFKTAPGSPRMQCVYRKLPLISPGLIQLRKGFLMGF